MVVLPPGFFHDILPPGWDGCGKYMVPISRFSFAAVVA
jgi:hypothetical protein